MSKMGVEDMEKVPQQQAFVPPVHFNVPVDSEHKSKVLRLYLVTGVHHRVFHLNWISFFISFFSTFAAAPLVPIIRQDLNLTKNDINNAGIGAVVGAAFGRIMMGSICDALGPRYGHAFVMCITSTATCGMAMVSNNAGYLIARTCIGLCLAVFVACQYWTSIMFSPNVVGTANAFAGGWGNAGGGAVQLIMPLIYDGIANNNPNFVAWRYAFLVPAMMQVIIGLVVLVLGQDLPDGNYADLKRAGVKDKGNPLREIIVGMTNYRTLVLGLTYGYCFGVELTLDNVLAQYFFDQFAVSISTAGYYSSIFGLINFVSRPIGGIMSDVWAKRFGMRGRLWWVFGVELLGGVLCLVLGLPAVSTSLAATLIVLICFSFAVQAACGATYGVVPFVSKRSLGIVCGFVGAGGNAGSAVTQAIFFSPTDLTTDEGFRYMGIMIMGISCFILTIWFPMWGGAILPARKGATEEDYYLSEFNEREKQQGLHLASSKFINESKSQRGIKRLQAEALKTGGTVETVRLTNQVNPRAPVDITHTPGQSNAPHIAHTLVPPTV